LVVVGKVHVWDAKSGAGAKSGPDGKTVKIRDDNIGTCRIGTIGHIKLTVITINEILLRYGLATSADGVEDRARHAGQVNAFWRCPSAVHAAVERCQEVVNGMLAAEARGAEKAALDSEDIFQGRLNMISADVEKRLARAVVF